MADAVKIDTLRNVKDGLIRKMVGGGAILLAPRTAKVPESFTDANGALIALDGYVGLGRIAKAGAPTFTPEDTTEEVETWGEMDPSRRDLTASKLTVEATLQDTRKETLAIAANRDMAYMDAIKPGANGEIAIEDNPEPGTIEYRAFFIGVDGVGEDAFYFGRSLPRVMITRGPESWDPANAVTYPLTLTALKDSELGYSSKRFFGGPGAKKRLEAMGFTAAESDRVISGGGSVDNNAREGDTHSE
ncbi:hypothetical protein QP324_09130 [Corynebacterium sp. UMB0012]|uniref:phage tail tube protein n=1 Tax=Corynebacterium sp. UMB0012 TaxID=3046344 RepID=UPI0025512BE9|nr:hypothetical protein [Corynebacterium sp. UMB0012]MDK7048737.1 hypothetical protein [Corynebacterium sp. UMB0012]